MKKLFAILAVAGTLTACNNAAPKTDATVDSAKIKDSIAAAAVKDTTVKAVTDSTVKAVTDTAKAAVKEAGAKVVDAAKSAVKEAGAKAVEAVKKP